MRAVWSLIGIFMVVIVGDAYTTWACLHNPIPGVFEANPIANWMFGFLGLVPGLIVDGIITLLILVWLGFTKRIRTSFKLFILLLGITITTLAVFYNYQVMMEIGIA